MKKIKSLIVSILIFACCNVFAQSGSKNINVLFIGNSYTYVNDLPNLVKQLAAASGDTVYVESSTPGGYTLQMHSADANTLAEIKKKPWNYVVLQEQSQLPSFDPQSVNTDVIPYAKLLDSLIHVNNACTKTLFYMTWGRKYGDASNCAFYPPVCTYAGMQDRLKESYMRMADSTHAIVSPVGESFRAVISADSTIELYQTDYSHPSVAGSYLAACTFYEVLLHKSVIGNSFISTVDTTTALLLQTKAHATVRDSLSLWNIGTNEPWSDFTWNQIGQTGLANFISMSDSVLFQHFWDFGDGTTSTFANPSHQYLQNGLWPVYHLVFYACSTDSTMINISIAGPTGISDNENGFVNIYPNPASSEINISTNQFNADKNCIITLTNMQGSIILQQPYDKAKPINVSQLPNGIYIVELKGKDKVVRKKIIMQH